MNLKTALFAVLLTMALVSAAPVQVDESTETFLESEITGETYEVADAGPQSEKEKPTEEKNTEDSEARKAFNGDMLNVVIGAVDGAVDVALGAVTGAVDVALGTVTGAANIAAGTVTGAMGVISGTVDGTLGVISSSITKPSKQSAISTFNVYQPTYQRPAHPQLAYPGHPVVSRPATPLVQSNIVGTPPGPIMSNAVARESTNTEETDAISTDKEPAPTESPEESEARSMSDLGDFHSFTVDASMSVDNTPPAPSTKPVVVITTIDHNQIETVPEVSPVVVEETPIEETPSRQTKPIKGEKAIAAIEAELTPITAPVIAETIETDKFTPITDSGFLPIIAPVIAEPIVDVTNIQNKFTGPIMADDAQAAEMANTEETTAPITAQVITEEIDENH